MRIEANSGVVGVTKNASQAPAKRVPGSQDKAELAGAATLEKALEDAPDVRADKVARAKQLIALGDYPPAAMLTGVARLLARELEAAIRAEQKAGNVE